MGTRRQQETREGDYVWTLDIGTTAAKQNDSSHEMRNGLVQQFLSSLSARRD